MKRRGGHAGALPQRIRRANVLLVNSRLKYPKYPKAIGCHKLHEYVIIREPRMAGWPNPGFVAMN